jgi:hypothetical protein
MTPTSRLRRHSTTEIRLQNAIAAFVFVLFASHIVHAQEAKPQTGSVLHYAMIFRSQRVLTADQQRQREAEIQVWAKTVRDRGVTLDPRILGATDAYFEVEGDHVVSRPGGDDSSPGAIIFFDAASREQAIDVARSHPGLRYGVTVELREWQAPPIPGAKR